MSTKISMKDLEPELQQEIQTGGAEGPMGPPGPQGEPGPQGPPGTSADVSLATQTEAGIFKVSNDRFASPRTEIVPTFSALKQVTDNIYAEFDYVAMKQQENWITPTLTGGWIPNKYMPLRYFKNNFGMVHIEGTVEKTSSGSVVIFDIPVGYRPEYSLYVSMVDTNGKTYPVSISPGGVVACMGYSNIAVSVPMTMIITYRAMN